MIAMLRSSNLLCAVVAVFALAAATPVEAADLDLYVSLPKTLPPGEWKKYLGEIGSDTLVTYKLGAEGKPQSTVSLVWFHELYNSREMLEKAAPALKKILVEKIHKGDAITPDKQPRLPAPLFSLKGDEKDSLVLYYEFKHLKDTEDRKAGTYRYYYIFKPIDEKTAICLGVEVQIKDEAHATSLEALLFSCAFRTPAEVTAEAEAAAKATGKPATPAPAGGDAKPPAGTPAPVEPPKTTPETPAPAPAKP